VCKRQNVKEVKALVKKRRRERRERECLGDGRARNSELRGQSQRKRKGLEGEGELSPQSSVLSGTDQQPR
jgi:hypothetical protein